MLSRCCRLFFLAAAGVLVLPLPAQQPGHIGGLVRDSSLSVVPGAAVTLVHEDTGFRRTTRSGLDGAYSLASLQPGIYKVFVRKEGFRTLVRFGVKLDVAQYARLDFTLSLGSVQERIIVESSPLVPNSENASVGTVIGREWIERIPLNGRGLVSLLEMIPGTVVTPASRGEAGQFSANGQRPNANYFTVDGVGVNTAILGGGQPTHPAGGSLPAMSAFGSFHGMVSPEALDEFRVQTSTSVPEYGRLPGAHLSLSTRSGTNRLHGSLYAYGRHQALDANDWFANRAGQSRAPLRLRDTGGTLGGPLRRDRTFFFLSFEDLALRQPAAWRVAVPSLSTRAGAPPWFEPLLAAFPEPNGPPLGTLVDEWIGRSSRPAQLRSFSARADHALTSRVTLFGRIEKAPSWAEFGGPQVNRFALDSRGATVGVNANLGSVTQDFRASVSSAGAQSRWWQDARGPEPNCELADVAGYFGHNRADCATFLRFAVSHLGQIASGSEADSFQDQWNALYAVSFHRRSHHVRMGGDFRRIYAARPRPVGSFALMADSLTDLLSRRNYWTLSTRPSVTDMRMHEVSFFVQDTWRVHPRLTLSYGLRWEIASEPVVTSTVAAPPGAPTPFYPSVRLPSWPARYVNIAPRFGLARQIGTEGRTVLRAGTGIYYDSSLVVANDLLNGGPMLLWQFANPLPEVSGSMRSILSYGFDPALRLPRVWQWNVSLEHALTGSDVVSAGYIGAAGRGLLRREIDGTGGFGLVSTSMATNHAASDYHAFQAQWRRRLQRSMRAAVSYTWAHSIDTSSTDSLLHWTGSGSAAHTDRGSSDFDIRHALNASFTLDLRALRGWSLDGIFRARTGFPVTVMNTENTMGLTFANVFRPDLIPGVPVWLSDRHAPGGRRLNPDAFAPRPGFEQGSLGRNAIAGFGMAQMDAALHREFSLRDRGRLQLRLEAFNLFNRANLADPVRFLASPFFGESPSMLNLMLGTGTAGTGLAPMMQIGGARSFQVVVRFRF